MTTNGLRIGDGGAFGKRQPNSFGLSEVGDLEAQVFNKPQILIEVQMLNLELLPPFC